MIVYVVFGGMLATTWVQIIKAMLLMGGTILLSILVLAHFGFSFANFFNAIGHMVYHEKGVEVVKDFLQPGLRYPMIAWTHAHDGHEAGVTEHVDPRVR